MGNNYYLVANPKERLLTSIFLWDSFFPFTFTPSLCSFHLNFIIFLCHTRTHCIECVVHLWAVFDELVPFLLPSCTILTPSYLHLLKEIESIHLAMCYQPNYFLYHLSCRLILFFLSVPSAVRFVVKFIIK